MSSAEKKLERVYITTCNGSKNKVYHKKGCHFLGESFKKVSKNQAENFFRKCSFCFDD